MWVQPKEFGSPFFVFPLKPIRATCFNDREGGVLGQFFFFLSWSSGAGQPWGFFW